jgi:predicted peptidase
VNKAWVVMQAWLLSLLVGCSLPQGAAQLRRDALVGAGIQGARDYWVYLPAGYAQAPQRLWPVIVFLHGDGERGNGREELGYVLQNGPLYEAWIAHKPLPFIIVAPQLPLWGRDQQMPYLAQRSLQQIPVRGPVAVPSRPQLPLELPLQREAEFAGVQALPVGLPQGWELLEQDFLQILQQVQTRYRTDSARWYLTGVSYGGFGCWHFASRFPQRFAAVAPVVAWGHPSLMAPIAQAGLPVWAFAAGRDRAVPISHFYAGIRLLESYKTSEVRFTVHEDAAHDVWQRIYSGEDIYAWFLQHSRNPGAKIF